MLTYQVVWTTSLLNECLEAGLVPSTRSNRPLFLSCTDSDDVDCDDCPLNEHSCCSTFCEKPFRDFAATHHPELLI